MERLSKPSKWQQQREGRPMGPNVYPDPSCDGAARASRNGAEERSEAEKSDAGPTWVVGRRMWRMWRMWRSGGWDVAEDVEDGEDGEDGGLRPKGCSPGKRRGFQWSNRCLGKEGKGNPFGLGASAKGAQPMMG